MLHPLRIDHVHFHVGCYRCPRKVYLFYGSGTQLQHFRLNLLKPGCFSQQPLEPYRLVEKPGMSK